MKKKNFTSKLQFQKTTVVSFNAMTNLKGGALQNVDTQVLSEDGFLCITGVVCTASQTDPVTSVDIQCPRPTTRTGASDFCGGTVGDTRLDCGASLLVC
ncbi:hypothetical protein IMCC3317_17340 [Kordia antarctica]|uniref:Uncharacterized protein n=1 Tax=Kordia antarctica TaxID=1218801 RepID=A0A7L4ZIA5_9FLAO|nr:class I lanthipeptide [Kordia antarctica]QHI36372.1 hypothetical protein IMCC3317_17340 [Kordia antarctica]